MAGANPGTNGLNILPVDDLPIERKPNPSELAVDRNIGKNTLSPAYSFWRRKVDKIFTANLLFCADSGYHHEDVISGERFFLSIDEIKSELARRDEVALNLGCELFLAYAADANWTTVAGTKIPDWEQVTPEIRKHWQAAAHFAIEKNRARQWPL